MSNSDSGFLNAEYAANVAELSDQYDVPQTAVEELYLDYCREIEQTMKDETPRSMIRQLAFNKTESHLAETDDSL